MRLVNPSTGATKPIDNGFEGRADGLTYTGTADGGNLIGLNNNDTVAIYPGVTVLVRLCGYEDASLVTMLKNLGLPLVFAASDHPY